MICPYCNAPAELVNSTVVYRTDYGMLWICSRWPQCDAYVSCHKGTTKPKGMLANGELRQLRIAAHELFDHLWDSGLCKRDEAYQWLMTVMGMTREEAHIAKFNVEQCRQLIRLLEIPRPYKLLSVAIEPPGERGWTEAVVTVSDRGKPREFHGGALSAAFAFSNAIDSLHEQAERIRENNEERKHQLANQDYHSDRLAVEEYERERP